MKHSISIFILSCILTLSSFAQLLPVRHDFLWGYADMKGQLVITPQFHDANFFSEGLGRVRQNGLYGFIDDKGEWIIPNQFVNAADFSGGLALVTDTNNVQYFINTKGTKEISLPEDIALAESFVNGYCKISKFNFERKKIKEKATKKNKDFIPKETIVENSTYKMGFMDIKGNIVIQPIYDDVSDFDKTGIARFVQQGKMGVLNTSGVELVKPTFIYIGPFIDGLALCQKGDSYGYINTQGKLVIKPRFDNGGDFANGLAPVMIDSLWGYIDISGKLVIKPKYDYAESFSEGMAGIVLNRKWGMIDTKGEMIIRNIFQDYAPFSEGLAAVKLKDGWGYIDKTGTMVILPQYNIVGSFINGVSLVEDDKSAIYINKNGTPIYSYDVSKVKKQDKKKAYFWNNVEIKYENQAQDYLKTKKKSKK